MKFYNPKPVALDNGVSKDQFERALVDMVKDKPILLSQVEDVLESQYNITCKGKLSFCIEELSQVKISKHGETEYLVLAGSRDLANMSLLPKHSGGAQASNNSKALGSVEDPFEMGLAQITGVSPILSQTEEVPEIVQRSDGEQNAQDGVVVDGSSNFDEEPYETVESSPIEDVEPVQESLLDEAIDESGKRDEDVQPQEDVGQSPEASYSLQINKRVKQFIRTINEELGKAPNSECDLVRISSKYKEYFGESLNAAVKKETDSRYSKILDYLRSQSSVFDVRQVRSTEVYVKSREDLTNMQPLPKRVEGGRISNKPYVPFCVGFLKKERKLSATGFPRDFNWVNGVGSDGQQKNFSIKSNSSQLDKSQLDKFESGELVYARYNKEGAIIFYKSPNMQPIQVLPWSNFVQSDEEDAVSFLSKKPQGALSYQKKSVFGNKQSASQILIYDEKNKKYLKGFSAYAFDDIRYTNVYEFDGNFIQLAEENQFAEYDFPDGNQFSVLVPPKANSDKTRHAVLDDSRWKALGSVGDSFETGLAQITGVSPILSQTEEVPEIVQRSDGEQNAPDDVVVDVSHNLDEAPYETVESTSVEDVNSVQVLHQEAETDESGMRDEDVQPQEGMGQSPEASYSLQINKRVKQIIRTINEELGKAPNSECDLVRISLKYKEYFGEPLNVAVKKGTGYRYLKIRDYLRSQSSVFDVRHVGSTEVYVKSREDLANMPFLPKHSGGAQAFNNSKALGSVGDPFEMGLSQITGASPILSQIEEVPEIVQRSDGEQNAPDGVVVDVSHNLDEAPHETVKSTSVEDVSSVQVLPQVAETNESGNREEDVQPQEDVEQPLETLPHEDLDEECAFLRAFHDGVQKAGFHYNLRDIVRFHTSLKCCPFTLLGGAPGTGKSSLVTLYAKALREDKYKAGYLPIDVSSSWTDSEDLFGYWDMSGDYRVAASGIVPFMWNADDESEEDGITLPKIVCFEEMNLARVEHYFSNMIQVLSRPVSERVLKGIPKNKDKNPVEKDQAAELAVAENLRFVGTCNFDETTQAFSARFYDRCSYLELSPVENKEPFSGVVPSVENYDAANSLTSYLNAYESWHRASGEIDANVKETYKTIQQNFRNVGVYISPRVENQIRLYILNRPNVNEKNDDRESQMLALDEAIVQMVLPRVFRTGGCPYDGNERLKKVMGICESFNLDQCKQFLQSQLNQFETPERV